MQGWNRAKQVPENIPKCIVGRNRYNPVDMLRTELLAFVDKGYCSLLELEDKYRINMREMYLMNWKTPSYHTFGYFINEVLLDSIEEIFRDINIAIFKQDHENLSHLYIDGTKLKVNANKYTWV